MSFHDSKRQPATRLSHLLLGQRLKVRRILGVSFPASRAQLVLVRSDSMPTEPADLIATGARVETQIVDF